MGIHSGTGAHVILSGIITNVVLHGFDGNMASCFLMAGTLAKEWGFQKETLGA
jgi:hypothetical protein